MAARAIEMMMSERSPEVTRRADGLMYSTMFCTSRAQKTTSLRRRVLISPALSTLAPK